MASNDEFYLRCATLNIHACCDIPSEQTLIEFVRTFRPPLDVLCFQESQEHYVDSVKLALGLPHHFYSPARFMGQSILSRYPLRRCECHELRVVSRQGRNYTDRSVGLAEVMLPNGSSVAVVSTHFDHVDEWKRVIELHQVFKHLDNWLRQPVELKAVEANDDDDPVDPETNHPVETSGAVETNESEMGSLPVLLVGDLNSLSLLDYDDEDIASINDVRARSSWEMAQGDVVETLKQNWQDCIEQGSDSYNVKKWKKQSSRKNPQVSKKQAKAQTGKENASRGGKGASKGDFSEQDADSAVTIGDVVKDAADFRWRKGAVQGTCFYGTRIDYIWYATKPETKTSSDNIRVVPGSYRVYTPKEANAKQDFTDHNCVSCVFQILK